MNLNNIDFSTKLNSLFFDNDKRDNVYGEKWTSFYLYSIFVRKTWFSFLSHFNLNFILLKVHNSRYLKIIEFFVYIAISRKILVFKNQIFDFDIWEPFNLILNHKMFENLKNGAANMSGIKNGLNKKVQYVSKKALYLHCTLISLI